MAAAMDRLERGEPSLARLAAELGFADQAHLTRTVRAHLGHTPAALRRLLTPGTGAAGGGDGEQQVLEASTLQGVENVVLSSSQGHGWPRRPHDEEGELP